MTKLKVFSLLPALLLASIVQAWEAPDVRNPCVSALFRGQVPLHLSHPAFLPEKETLLLPEDCQFLTPSQKLSSGFGALPAS